MLARIRLAWARRKCRRHGHQPRTIRSFEEALAWSLTNCRRCGAILGGDEHRGRFPLPRERMVVEHSTEEAAG